jgi:hypothetical protein
MKKNTLRLQGAGRDGLRQDAAKPGYLTYTLSKLSSLALSFRAPR